MRIGVYHNLPRGGAMRQLREVVTRLTATDEVFVVCPDLGSLQPPPPPSLADAGVVQIAVSSPLVHRAVPGVQPAHRLLALTDTERRAAHVIEEARPDVVLVFPCRITQTPALLRHLRSPSLYYAPEPRRRSIEDDYRPEGPPTSRWRATATPAWERMLRRRDRRAMAAAGRVAVNSRHTAAGIRRAYGRDSDVCPPGVDGSVFTADGHRIQGDPFALSVGRLDTTKGHELAVEALSRIPGRPLGLRVVGEDAAEGFEATLRAAGRRCGVPLSLAQRITDEALATLYRSASVTLALARREPFGLTPLESMACGTPVVALDEGGYLDTIVDGEAGRLVRAEAGAVAAAVDDVLRGCLRASTAPEVRATVWPRWSWESSTALLREALVQSVGGARVA